MQADLEEGRNVFEEGNAFTLEALQHQVAPQRCLTTVTKLSSLTIGLHACTAIHLHYSRSVVQTVYRNTYAMLTDHLC